MKRFEHGGDTYPHRGVLDFSANLNPFGMSASIRAALRKSIDRFDAYPDPHCRELTRAIAQHEGVSPDHVLVCAGATDAMTRVCLALRPRRGLVCPPCYSGYEQALEQAGAQVVRHFSTGAGEFELLPSMVDRLDGIDLLFLANPNNPTGLTLERSLLEYVLAGAQVRGTSVVLDESFLDFTEERSAVDLLRQFENLVILKSFTKMYSMAGLRLGYLLCADPHTMEACRAMGQMWAVSTPAQVAGMAALAERDLPRLTREYVSMQRKSLLWNMRGVGLHVVPGKANYLLFRSERPLYVRLLNQGILVRQCENYPGLDRRWYRVAVRTAEENHLLVRALEEVLS